MKGSNNIFIILLCFLAISSHAQDLDSVTNDPSKTNRYFRFTYDNDFFSATDRYYTQGTILELIAPVFKKSPFSYILIGLNKYTQKYYGLSLQQDVFTPKSIRMDTLNYQERPFTSTAVFRHTLYCIDNVKKERLTTSFELGIIGPNGKGEETQKGIHKALDNIAPLGWEWQLSQDIVINYNAIYEKGIVTKKHFELMGVFEGRIGTLYDDASGGITFRVGKMNSYFKNFGVVKNDPENKFQLYLTGKAKAKLVGYNATLQGGLFSTSVYEMDDETVERKVYSLSAGITLVYKRVSLDYVRYYLTKEFYRGIDHGWGRCNITVCF